MTGSFMFRCPIVITRRSCLSRIVESEYLVSHEHTCKEMESANDQLPISIWWESGSIVYSQFRGLMRVLV